LGAAHKQHVNKALVQDRSSRIRKLAVVWRDDSIKVSKREVEWVCKAPLREKPNVRMKVVKRGLAATSFKAMSRPRIAYAGRVKDFEIYPDWRNRYRAFLLAPAGRSHDADSAFAVARGNSGAIRLKSCARREPLGLEAELSRASKKKSLHLSEELDRF
jgi:hypothetical protein